MPSIAGIQHKLKAFDTFARRSDNTDALRKKWHALFGTDLTEVSAKSFAAHYREMRSKSTRGHKSNKKSRRGRKGQRGGVGAPLNYVMTPGANVSVYGRFPVEVDTDPGSIKDLDVYFQSALTLGCGNKTEFWPTVPANMGSNQVGGRRGNRKGRNTRKGRKGGKARTMRRRQRGGDVFDTIGSWLGNGYTSVIGAAPPTLDDISRPAFSTVYPNVLQRSYMGYSGEVPGNYPAPSQPEKATWNYVSNGTTGVISPQHVTSITKDFNNIVNPSLYSTSSPKPYTGV